jgi:hypothetical protein
MVRVRCGGGGGGQQALVAVEVAGVVAEVGDEHRPLIEDTDHDDVAGVAGIESGRIAVVAVADRVIEGDVRERREGFDVDVDAARAIEQARELGADAGLERRGGHAVHLRLAGHDQPRRILRRRLHRLRREEDQRRLEDGEDHHQERDADHGELDRD